VPDAVFKVVVPPPPPFATEIDDRLRDFPLRFPELIFIHRLYKKNQVGKVITDAFGVGVNKNDPFTEDVRGVVGRSPPVPVLSWISIHRLYVPSQSFVGGVIILRLPI
jgi:hypothetical protein